MALTDDDIKRAEAAMLARLATGHRAVVVLDSNHLVDKPAGRGRKTP